MSRVHSFHNAAENDREGYGLDVVDLRISKADCPAVPSVST